jgi:hypothetical protein
MATRSNIGWSRTSALPPNERKRQHQSRQSGYAHTTHYSSQNRGGRGNHSTDIAFFFNELRSLPSLMALFCLNLATSKDVPFTYCLRFVENRSSARWIARGKAFIRRLIGLVPLFVIAAHCLRSCRAHGGWRRRNRMRYIHAGAME